ncbi:hypothetical protein ABPG75_009995 [Micractinium tetrahymenae]
MCADLKDYSGNATGSGNRYLLAIVDLFTKFTMLYVLMTTVPSGAAPPAPALLGSGGVNMIVPLGVILGCVTMAAVVLMLWLVSRRMDREATASRQAADEERGRRCSLESDCGAPYLPKLPVIIMLPDNKSLSFGWQLEHSPCAAQTPPPLQAKAAAPVRQALQRRASRGHLPAPAPTLPLPHRHRRQQQWQLPLPQHRWLPPLQVLLRPARRHRRPPLVSIRVLGPDQAPIVQPWLPSPESTAVLESQPEAQNCEAAQPAGGAAAGATLEAEAFPAAGASTAAPAAGSGSAATVQC